MDKYFEKVLKGISCQFEILDSMVSNQANASDYCAKIKKNYDSYFKDKDAMAINKFGVRYYRAKKLIYSSAQMWVESKISKDNECMVSYYFLIYYALFQAMQANIIINPNVSNEKAEKLGHGEVSKYFETFYCNVKNCPVDKNIISAFEKLRDCREYFSYAMPFNLSEEILIDETKIDYYLKGCYQLINLQLFVLSEKCKRSIRINKTDLDNVKSYLIKQCNRLGGTTNFLDPADEDFWIDIKDNLGIDIMPISIVYDHDFDEYGTYDSEIYIKAKMPNTGKVVSGALQYLGDAIY
jgi:hypothetical protein